MHPPLVRAGLEITSAILLLMTAPLVLELLLLTAASLFPARRRGPQAGRLRKLAVIIPAHNEALLVERCVRSLAEQSGSLVRLLVVAHNCVDDTAEKARRAGADVLVLNDPEQRGKACALRSGFAHALEAGAEAVAVVDADSIVSPGFVASVQSALSGHADAVQCRYRVLQDEEDRTPVLRTLAFQGFNLVRPRGRDRLGLSAGIFGNGFGMRREVLEAIPYSADSVVEDLEYHLQLVGAGIRVRFLEEATVFGEMPDGGDGSQTQRARWEGGRFMMMKTLPPRLIKEVMRGKLRMLEPILDIFALPIALGALLLFVSVAVPVTWLRWYAAASLAVMLVHVVVAVKAGPNFWRGIGVLVRAPSYIAWKLLLMPKILLSSKRNASWVRTQRDQPAELCSTVNPDAVE